jgi:ferredoxin
VKLQIDAALCQGHGRCYDLAPELFGDDDEGFGQVLGDGIVPPDKEHEARLAVANCPERAVSLTAVSVSTAVSVQTAVSGQEES